MKSRWIPLALAAVVAAHAGLSSAALGAGTLKPKDSSALPIAIRTHDVAVVIRDGYARTEVRQTFFNPNAVVQEAVYSFPIPKSAALSEVEVSCGEENLLRGEVVPRDEARRAYEEEKNAGANAALAEKQGLQTFEFAIANVAPQSEVGIRCVYYQSAPLDTGVGRYLYPLEDGGNDVDRAPFWETNSAVESAFAVRVELHSSYPVAKVYAPGYESATVERPEPGVARMTFSTGATRLDRDFVFYWALEDALPGRLEVVPFRAPATNAGSPGTFMLTLTPGVDLRPLQANGGADWTFVLDVSGSMAGKLGTLGGAVGRALTTLTAGDRFRIVTFASDAQILTRGFLPAAPETIGAAVESVRALTSRGGTNLEAGVRTGLSELDSDRAQAIVLVTDGVANIGGVTPASFEALLAKADVRVFGFLLGNSANWPLMEAITRASGGFYESLSNDDDIVSRLALVKPKLAREAMHGVELEVTGCGAFDVDSDHLGSLYHGQQLVAFGRYAEPGRLRVVLECKITGEPKSYSAEFDLPAVAQDAPEIERLFGLHRVERLQRLVDSGLAEAGETKAAIRDLGVEYQLVTDHTSMLVLDDAAFARRGIARRNEGKVATERAADAVRRQAPVANRRVDSQAPMFQQKSASRDGGAVDEIVLGLGALVLLLALRKK